MYHHRLSSYLYYDILSVVDYDKLDKSKENLRWISIIEECCVILTYVSPPFYCDPPEVFVEGLCDDIDDIFKNCYIVANYTGEMKHVQQETDNLLELCKIQ